MAKKRKATASEATATDADEDEDVVDDTDAADAADSDDLGDPTEDVPEGTDTQPDGQTAAGSAELGPAPDDDDFADPVTNLDPLGTKRDTRVRDEGETKEKFPKSITALAKGMGLKKADILGYNERTRVAVFNNGGKYQLSKKGNSVRHLAGPKPPADIDLGVVDARTRSPFTGTAAAINASVHANDNSALQRRREDLARQLAAVDEQLEATA